MITEGILNLIAKIMEVMLSVFPVMTMPYDVIGGLGGFLEIMGTISIFFPLNTFSILLAIWIFIEGTTFLSSAVSWALRKVPTIG